MILIPQISRTDTADILNNKQFSLDILELVGLQKQPPEVAYRKGVLRNFVKFTGKHLCRSLVLNKVAGLRPVTLLKKRLWHRCLPLNFTKFLKTSFYRTPLDDCFLV